MRILFEEHKMTFFWLILVVFSIPVTLVLIHDIDIWWHILLGKEYLTHFRPPDFSEFYFTPVNQHVVSIRFTWLGDIFFYLVYWAGGDVGLQLSRFIMLFGACYIIFLSGGKKINGWKMLCLMGVIIGTYQTQLVRNSIFSLVFTPLLFYIWYLFKFKNNKTTIWIYPIFIGVWGCMHGSYLLGFGLLTLILIGDSFDQFILAIRSSGKFSIRRIDFKTISIYFLILIISFVLISVKNPKTQKYFRLDYVKRILFVDNSFEEHGIKGPIEDEDKRSAQTKGAKQVENDIYDTDNINYLYWLKAKLNNTLFDTQGSVAVSGDFASPFDFIEQLYVIVALIFGSLGLLSLFFYIRPFRFSYFLPAVAVIFFGCGYVRMVGYIPLVVASIWFIAEENGELNLKMDDAPGYCVSIFCLVLLYIDFAFGFKVRIGTALHSVGVGRIPIYSEKCPDRLWDKYKTKQTFTNGGNGGYLLLRWYPEKKVFLDGFFEPHQVDVTADYLNMVAYQQNPDFLYDKYRAENAILGLNIGNAIRPFIRSRNWFPECVDKGQIVFIYRSEDDKTIVVPEILESEEDALNLPHQYRKLLSEFSFHIVNSLLIKGHIKDAGTYLEINKQMLAALAEYAPSKLVSGVKEKFSKLKKNYGNVNDRSLYYEEQHSQAVIAGQEDKILEYGYKILRKYPGTYHIIYNMALVFVKQQRFAEARVYLQQLKASPDKNPEFWGKHQDQTAALFKKSVLIEKDRRNFNSAFNFLLDSFLFGQELLSDVEFFKEGLFLYSDLKKSGKPLQAFRLLKQMNEALPDHGRLLNAMAWHILTEPSPEGKNEARGYALKSVDIMEKENDETLDMAYDTLAEASFRLKDYGAMEKYEEKAIRLAPESRKSNYKRRVQDKK